MLEKHGRDSGETFNWRAASMKGDCKNCGHWLVASYYDPMPFPHLKRSCYKCGAVWKENAQDLLHTLQVEPPVSLPQGHYLIK